MGKIEGSSEIWNFHEDNIANQDFEWYNKGTGRSFNRDIKAYSEEKVLPPFWQTTTSPFQKRLPQNLLNLIGNTVYTIDDRFDDPRRIFDPDLSDILEMIQQSNAIMGLRTQLWERCKYYRAGFKRRRK
jgi:hypothetical protein